MPHAVRAKWRESSFAPTAAGAPPDVGGPPVDAERGAAVAPLGAPVRCLRAWLPPGVLVGPGVPPLTLAGAGLCAGGGASRPRPTPKAASLTAPSRFWCAGGGAAVLVNQRRHTLQVQSAAVAAR